MRITKLLSLTVISCYVIGALGCRPARTGALIVNAAADGSNWLSHGRDYAETRHSPLEEVNTKTVSRLGLAWFHDLDTNRGQESTPLAVDGVLYVTTAWSKVLALDALTGEQLWSFDPKVPGETGAKVCCDVVNRGVAYWEGKVFLGTLDGRLIGLDAKTGKELWSVVTVDQRKAYSITGAPRVIKGKVIIGNGGAEFGVRGYVTAYDATTGKQVWRFYTVPGEPGKSDGAASDPILRKVTRTWSGEWWRNGGGGGTVWDSMAYDPELDLLYIGVGNGSYWRKSLRSPGGGDNLFLGSIVALRPETGEYVWHYQETPGEQWDYTSTQQMILADIRIGTEQRKVLMQAPKNGFFFVIDRTNGRMISAQPYTAVNWASGFDQKTGRPILNPDADYSTTGKLWLGMPGVLGGHDWQPMAFDPSTGWVYIPEQQIGFPYQPAGGFEPKPVGVNLGVDLSVLEMPDDPKVRATIRAGIKGSLEAWDPNTQRKVWSVPHAGAWNGGVLSTSGHLIFQGDADGMLAAYDSRDGSKLWSYDCQSGIVAPPITWARNDKQYVTVVVGWGGVYPLVVGSMSWNDKGPVPNRSRVVTFTLDGKAQLPPVVAAPEQPLRLPLKLGDESMIQQGMKAYYQACTVCHGPDAESGGTAPDLRHSAALADSVLWKSVVADGALAGKGMVGFKDDFSETQIQAIRAYVIARALATARRDAQAPRDPGSNPR